MWTNGPLRLAARAASANSFSMVWWEMSYPNGHRGGDNRAGGTKYRNRVRN